MEYRHTKIAMLNYSNVQYTSEIMTSFPQNPDDFNLAWLDKDWKLATLYTAFLDPKTQQQAIAMIYRGATMGISENWIIDAKRKLIEKNYLIKTDNKERNSIYKANVDPIVSTILSYQKSQFSKKKSNEKIILCLKIFLNSKWFRSFFDTELFTSPIKYSDMTIYRPYIDLYKKSLSGLNYKLEIDNVSERISHLLYDIGYYSHNIRWEMLEIMEKERLVNQSDEELLEEIMKTGDFDLLIQNNKDTIPQYLLVTLCTIIKNTAQDEYCGRAPLKLFYKLFKSGTGCFIPNDFALVLRLLPTLPESERSLDFGMIRKMLIMYRLYKIPEVVDSHCIDRYLAEVDLGKENL